MLRRAISLCLILCGAAAAEEREPKLLWAASVAGLQKGCAAVQDGQIFAPVVGGSSIVSLDAQDGSVRWTRQLSDSSPWPPIVDQQSVYVITGSCTLYSLSRADGRVQWSRWLAGSISSMPTLDGTRLYAASNAYTSHATRTGGWHLICLDARTGKEQWATRIGADAVGAPLVSGGRIYVTNQHGDVIAFDPQKGKPVWKASPRAASMPVPCREWLVVRTPFGLSAVHREDGTHAWEWKADPTGVAEFQATTAGTFVFPMIAGERAYVSDARNKMKCVDLKTRKTAWTWSGGDEKPGEPVMVGGRLYFGTSAGTVLGLNARSGETMWAVRTAGAIVDAPTIMDGTIYFHDQKGGVLAVDAGTPSATGWGMWGGSASHTGSEKFDAQPADVVTPSASDGAK